MVLCTCGNKRYVEAIDVNFLVSVAGGEKYLSSSMVILLCELGRIIGTFCVLVDCRFAIYWYRCPSDVATEDGKH